MSNLNTVLAFKERAGKPGGGKGILIGEDRTFTLSTMQQDAVCYAISSYESNAMKSKNPHSGIYEATTSRTLDTSGGNPAIVGGSEMDTERKYVLRRLTPIECLRLQGYPDWWCDGANGSDSAIYKAAGNSLAIPCCADVIGRIVRFVEQEKKENK